MGVLQETMVLENPTFKWMRTGGTSMTFGHPQMVMPRIIGNVIA